MKMSKWVALLCGSILAGAALNMSTTALSAQESCGTVSISSMNWQSAELIAAIDAYILEKGLGCTVELVMGDTVPTLLSMAEKGQPDVAPEARTSLFPQTTLDMIDEGRLVMVGLSMPDGADMGVYVPKFIVDKQPEVATMDGLFDHPELFPDAENTSRGGFHAGQQGWGGTIILSQFYKAWKGEERGWNLIDTGSAAGHDGSLIRAMERGIGWAGLMWEPQAILGRYEMVRVDEGVPYDEVEWNRCYLATNICDDPKPNKYDSGDITTLVTKEFAERGTAALDYFKIRGFKTTTLNQMLAWMDDNQATGEQGALHYLKTYPEEWTPWVSLEVAEKIKASL